MQGRILTICFFVFSFLLQHTRALQKRNVKAIVRKSGHAAQRPTHVSAQLDGTGALIRMASSVKHQDKHQSKHQQTGRSRKNTCDVDWQMGEENANNCGTELSVTENSDSCEQAAHESHATVLTTKYHLPEEFRKHRPPGCFKEPCAAGKNHVCFYYNPELSPAPDNVTQGTPVCHRPRHLYGVVNSGHMADNAGCPTNYTVIMDRDYCIATAECLGVATATDFDVGMHNQSHHLDHPFGCFLDVASNKAYFNNVTELKDTALNTAGRIRGQPICMIAMADRLTWEGTKDYHAGLVNASTEWHNSTDDDGGEDE